MNGISGINIELTSRCNKACFMCGRRKMERDYPDKCDWGDIPMATLRLIARQIPKGVFVQLHWNGEPLIYPQITAALRLFKNHYVGLDTNGKLLIAKQEAIRNYLTSITVSIIPNDPEGPAQFRNISTFLSYGRRPLVVLRLLGKISMARVMMFDFLDSSKVIICNRVLHAPEGSMNYERPVTIPEVGICLEALHKLAIDRHGDVYPCVRYNPEGANYLGNVEIESLDDIATGQKRTEIIKMHLDGRRSEIPLCKDCEFWGCPVS